MYHFLEGVFSRQISLCRNFHSKVGVGVISDVGVISVEYGTCILASIPGPTEWWLVYFARTCAKLFVYLSILHTKFHIQIVNKRKMYTEEKYVRPDLW